ncbi:MAG: hypothetical protein IKK51_06875, partial [Oscillospiraceae bacterium]|nr:hypothetical protein [Oscillospiraceae bacterium]
SLLLCAIYIALCVYSHFVFKQRVKPVQPVHLKPKASEVKREAARKVSKERQQIRKNDTTKDSE